MFPNSELIFKKMILYLVMVWYVINCVELKIIICENVLLTEGILNIETIRYT
jgi:hypothetical protein